MCIRTLRMFGDESGGLTIVHFLQPLNSLFAKEEVEYHSGGISDDFKVRANDFSDVVKLEIELLNNNYRLRLETKCCHMMEGYGKGFLNGTM